MAKRLVGEGMAGGDEAAGFAVGDGDGVGGVVARDVGRGPGAARGAVRCRGARTYRTVLRSPTVYKTNRNL